VLDAVAKRERSGDEASGRGSGKAVVVTWRTDRDAKPSNFSVFATATRSGSDFSGIGEVTGSGRRFKVRLTDVSNSRYVQIVAMAKGARKTDLTIVRIRR
jgi:hypothetical protein